MKALLDELGLRGWPKTSGSRGMHVNVRIEPRWTFTEVRRAALAFSREIERRVPEARDVEVVEGGAARRLPRLQPERQGPHDLLGLFGAAAARRARVGAARLGGGRRIASRPTSRSRRCRSGSPTIGDPHAGMDAAAGSLEKLLELAARDEAAGLGDAPWPPHFRKMEGEAPRVAPSRAQSAPRREEAAREDAAHRRRQLADKEAALAGLERWKAKSPGGGPASRRRRRARRFDARPLVDLDAHPREPAQRARRRAGPPQETPDPDDDPTREWRAQVRESAQQK